MDCMLVKLYAEELSVFAEYWNAGISVRLK